MAPTVSRGRDLQSEAVVLISRTEPSAEGALTARLGRQGSMKAAGSQGGALARLS